jgi:hypothetical protein
MDQFRAALRDDIEAQFELPHLPPPMTKNRQQDFKKPCLKCEPAYCRCLDWKAFDVV